ncbi:hypothetical protein AWZ03_015239 [Drosophila navojoa]|uniref:Uncharacterized protein n=1 Tax=Drosophila navojoa TaxID=7232 RepID=A0A484AN94_DRONA|nr:hypothetical protein AWZ03_015239 [Drosophila navojoa]
MSNLASMASGTDPILLFSIIPQCLDPISEARSCAAWVALESPGLSMRASNLMSLTAAAMKSGRDILTGFAGFGLDRVTTGLRLKVLVVCGFPDGMGDAKAPRLISREAGTLSCAPLERSDMEVYSDTVLSKA